MICFPNAKINLGLNIVSQREDGYHNIETVFYPIGVRDALEIVPAKEEKGRFVQSGIPVDGDPDQNLVVKAYRVLKEQFELPEIDIYLQKNIPFGAGLGGGSADAAFMLKLLNEFADLNLNPQELERYAARIGADCPFFIGNNPVFAEGIGNIFSPVKISLKDYFLVLVKPAIHVSTKEAYSLVRPRKPLKNIREIIPEPIDTWKDNLVNDFEVSVFSLFPAIKTIKEELYHAGAVYSSMSGSGSSVFGIFRQETGTGLDFPNAQTYYNIPMMV